LQAQLPLHLRCLLSNLPIRVVVIVVVVVLDSHHPFRNLQSTLGSLQYRRHI
jgi:hypothetical protein